MLVQNLEKKFFALYLFEDMEKYLRRIAHLQNSKYVLKLIVWPNIVKHQHSIIQSYQLYLSRKEGKLNTNTFLLILAN